VEIDLAFAGISSDLDYVASDQEDVVFGDQAADVGSVSASGQQTQATNVFFAGFLLDIGLLRHCRGSRRFILEDNFRIGLDRWHLLNYLQILAFFHFASSWKFHSRGLLIHRVTCPSFDNFFTT
jgi:hypothetical protein